MHIETLDDIPLIDAVLEMQRAMSEARTEAELVYAFASRLHEVSGVSEVMDLSVRDLPAGSFRVMDRLQVTDPELSRETVRRNSHWDQPWTEIPVHGGGVVGTLASGTHPKLVRGLDPADDPVLGEWLAGQRDALAIPVYYGGRIDEWLVVFRAPGLPIDPIQLRVSVAILNMLSRSVYQLKLTREVSLLHQQLAEKLEEVARVQRAILPARLPAHPQLEVAASYRPCDSAGGDYYDFSVFEDGSLGLVVADVSGHGPAAAVVMAMLHTAMSIYRGLELPAGNVAQVINRFMADGLTDGTFVTAFFLCLDPTTGRAAYANAGHVPGWLRRVDGTLERLDAGGAPPLGVLPEIESSGGEVVLQPGDVVVVVTDGITEAFDHLRQPFGAAGLADTLRATAGDAHRMLAAILAAVEAHAGDHPQEDDQCVVVVSRQQVIGDAAGPPPGLAPPPGGR